MVSKYAFHSVNIVETPKQHNGGKIMRVVICMPTGKDGIQDDLIIRDSLLTVVNRITLLDEKSGEFEADNDKNMVTFKVEEV
jgi:hypothetical protein